MPAGNFSLPGQFTSFNRQFKASHYYGSHLCFHICKFSCPGYVSEPVKKSKPVCTAPRSNFQNTSEEVIMKKLARALRLSVAVAVIFCAMTALMAEETQNREMPVIDQLCQNFAFQSENADHDPFRPLITKKVIEPVKIERQPEPVPQKEVAKVIPPLKLAVTGICGNDNVREAVIQFENDEHIVRPGQVVNGKFKVVDIENGRVVVYSIGEARRATFALNEN